MIKKIDFFSVLQRVGAAFMLPIALLPIAGLMLGIGASFTNELTIATYGLQNFFGQGTFLNGLLTIMKSTGEVIFANLPILFAIGVAAGMARKEKYVAAIAGAVGFFVMHTTIHTLLLLQGLLEPGIMADGSLSTVLGIQTLEIGVFGGVVVGLGVASLHNRYYKIELPTVLSFFGGIRFIPIITTVVYLLVGVVLFYIWPGIQRGISYIGDLVNALGYLGTFIFGVTERGLIPFGLHHVFYMPFWQTAVGGTEIIDGVSVSGAQNIFFAQLASPNTTHFSVEATKYMMGKFPMMLFGIPGAALAIYHTGMKEKKQVAGLLISATLTAVLTGITEPLEFSFLFAAPLLYAIHCLYSGLSFMLAHLLNVAVGQTFSGSLIDFILFGIMQGNEKTNWLNVVWIGMFLFPLYYFTFKAVILKFNFATPGREPAGKMVKLYTKADMSEKNQAIPVSSLIVTGLGEVSNIVNVDACATRLRVTVKDEKLIDKKLLTQSGAKGVIIRDKGIQVIYGPEVAVIKSNLEEYLEQEVAYI